ncbi:MAG: M23 family metallopeptidase [Bdellovibrionales bacterium]|nr:M23 family metallopeptidase [Bdellovibrionales bacterium]
MSKISSLSVTLIVGFFPIALIGCSTFSGPGSLQAGSRFLAADEMESSFRNYVAPNTEFQLSWPVGKYRLTQRFAPPKNPSHDGIDLAGRRRSKIKAAHSGVVVYAGNRYSGYGKMVILEFNHQWATLYAHMDKLNVKTGDLISAGQVLGLMGRTGRASGVHLHFELIKDKQPIDPLPYLPGNPHSNRRVADKTH